MKRLYTLLLILFSVHALTMAQLSETNPGEKKHNIKIGITGGMAFYDETALQKLNTELIETLPFEVAIIDNFPPYHFYGGSVLTSLDARISLGLSYQFYTTGSRLGARDYSASYSFDQVISSHSLGIVGEFSLLKIAKTAFFCELTAGTHLASWKLEENFILGEESEKDLRELKAIKPFFYPCLKWTYPITPHIGIAVKGGYSFDILGKFKMKNDPQAKSDTKVSFSGARMTLALEYQL